MPSLFRRHVRGFWIDAPAGVHLFRERLDCSWRMSSTGKLLSIGSEALSCQPVMVKVPDFGGYGALGDELLTLLRQKNGFYAENALAAGSKGVSERSDR